MKGLLLGVSLVISLAVMTQSSNAAVDACGATIVPHVGGGTIVSCPPLSTTNGEGCLLTLKFLQCEKKHADSAIQIFRDDLVVWDSDLPDSTTGKPYKFRFDKFDEIYKSVHTECAPDPSPSSPPPNHKKPFPNITSEKHRRNHAAYVDSNVTAGTCFKHYIYVGEDPQHESPFDPHVIIGDGTRDSHDHSPGAPHQNH